MFNSKQLLFIEAYLKDADHIEAYRTAFKVKDKQIARVAGLRLLKSPKIAKIISEKQAVNEKIIAAENERTLIKGAQNGLKSKIDRLLLLQNEIVTMQRQLAGEVEFTFKLGNAIKHSHNAGNFMLPIETQNDLRSVIKSYQSEISKIEGDYAPTNTNVAVVSAIKIIRE